jgi:beta-phosphoglucomutase-like phosphatase (HAD superfamily)
VTPPAVLGLILDFDGLILDTESPIFDEWRSVFAARGHELGIDVWQHGLGTAGRFDPCDHLARVTGEAVDRDALLEDVRARIRRGCEALPLLPGVEARVREARAAGLSTAVASSSSSGWVEGWLRRHCIRELFDAVCTRDDVQRVKPEPDLFLLAARRLGAPAPSCVVFEDSPNGIRAARAAGMRCVAVPNPVTRGLRLDEADLVVASLADHSLAEILRRLTSDPPSAPVPDPA